MPPSRPDVTVITGVYNAMPYLTRCMTSAAEQSIGRARMEIIVVDDGSTDGSGAELDRLRERYPGLMTVLHQENSGGPAAPRNTGLDRATGRYVFFLDADDHLGEEALERMVAVADDQLSDVVLGRVVGVGGRWAPRSMFRRNQPRTDVFGSRVHWTLNPMKLYRRDLVERLGLRFRTDLTIGEDQPFTATCYLHAAAISVVADYDCVYWVTREDGGNITRVTHGTRMRLRCLADMLELIGAHTAPGPGRDHLMHRHFTIDLRKLLNQLIRVPRREDREAAFAELRPLVLRWYGDGLAARLPAPYRHRCELIRDGLLDELLDVHRGARETAMSAGKPDVRPRLRSLAGTEGTFRVAGDLRLRPEPAEPAEPSEPSEPADGRPGDGPDGRPDAAELLLRERRSGAELRIPADEGAGGRHGFAVTVDPARAAGGAPLPPGLWDLHLEVTAHGVTRAVRLGKDRGPEVPTGPVTRIVRAPEGAAVPVTAYFTARHGNLTLDVGENKHSVPSLLRVSDAVWEPGAPSVLRVTGHCALTGVPGLPPGALTLRATAGDGHPAVPPSPAGFDGGFEAGFDGDGAPFAARLRLPRTPGELRFSLHLEVADRTWTVPVPAPVGLPRTVWWHRAQAWYAKPQPDAERPGTAEPGTEQLALRIGRVALLGAARRRLTR